MISLTVEKFYNCSFLFVLQGASSNSYHCSSWIPFDLAQNHRSIHSYWILVFVIFHKNESALLISNT